MHRIALALTLPLFAQLAAADGFELKGIKIGEPTPKAAICKAWDCKSYGGIGTQLAGSFFDLHYTTDKGRVTFVYSIFPTNQFDALAEAVVGKYGKPDQQYRTPMVNGFGGHFDQIEFRWNRDGQTWRMIRSYDSTKSFFDICSAEACKAFAEDAAKAKKAI